MAKSKQKGGALRDRMQNPQTYAPAWKPEPGQGLVGEIIDFDVSRPHPEYGAHPIINVQVEAFAIDGETQDAQADTRRAIHVLHHVLDESLRELEPVTGDRIMVTRMEDQTKGEGDARRTYRVFDVALERDGTLIERPGRTESVSAYAKLPETAGEGGGE